MIPRWWLGLYSLSCLTAIAIIACNDTAVVSTPPSLRVVDYDPWQWGYSQEMPVCRNADIIEKTDDEIRCEWTCAHYWTPGDIGPRNVVVGWRRGPDEYWRRAAVSEGTGVGPCE